MQIFTRHHHAFLKLLSYRMLMVFSYQIIAVTVGWHIYEITRDPLALGLIGLAEVVPYFACALFAGHAVDHYCSRRFFGTLAAVTLGINALLLTTLAIGYVGNSANESYWIYGSIMLTGVGRAFIAPSYNTLFALILPREEFAKASGIGSST
ncbi:MAG: MFS transporter, partial [Methylotenera sp.]